MARKVFFSFHYKDVLRANVVRKSDVVSRQYERASRFQDRSLWEEAKKQGDLAIKRMINGNLYGSSVTCVLIGEQTWCRPWVRYELLKSFEQGKGIFGVRIHDVGIEKPNPFAISGLQIGPGALANAPSSRSSVLTGGGGLAGSTLLTGGSGLQIGSRPGPGPDPFDFLGFTVDQRRRRITLYDYVSGAWRVNPHVEGVSLDSVPYAIGVDAGKFSRLFPIYSWKSEGGYRNFPAWVEQAACVAGR